MFLDGGVIYSPAGLVNVKSPSAPVLKLLYGKWPQGGSISSCPNLVTWATRALGNVLFLGCQLEWNVPEETPKACVKVLHPPYPFPPQDKSQLHLAGDMEPRALFKALPAQSLHYRLHALGLISM